MKKHIRVDLQLSTDSRNIPARKEFETWINTALKNHPDHSEVCIRIIDEAESQDLNYTYRHKNKPTNILSFPYDPTDDPDGSHLLGDLAICAAVIEKEAKEQKINLKKHWAHIVIHGCLHLIGYTHETDDDANNMESLEADAFASLEF